MRIGVIGPTQPDDFAYNILDALPRLGHEALRLGPGRPTASGAVTAWAAAAAWRSVSAMRYTQKRLVQRAASLELDVIISVEGELLPETVVALQKHQTKVSLWFPDNVGEMSHELMLIAPYDAVFFKDPELVQRTRNLQRVPAHYLPEACNPSWHTPGERNPIDPAVVMSAGLLYPARVRILDGLIAAGIPLRLYHAHPTRWIPDRPVLRLPRGRYLACHDKAKVFRSAAAVLNTMKLSEAHGINARVFEAAGCGAAVLCEHRPELASFFEPGVEVLSFTTLSELIDQAERLIADPDLGTRLGDAAAARAHREHTYEHRLRELLGVTLGATGKTLHAP